MIDAGMSLSRFLAAVERHSIARQRVQARNPVQAAEAALSVALPLAVPMYAVDENKYSASMF